MQHNAIAGVDNLRTDIPDWHTRPVDKGGIVGANDVWNATRDKLAAQLRDNAKGDMAENGLAGRLKFKDWQKAAEEEMQSNPKYHDLYSKKQLESDVSNVGRQKLLEKVNSPEYKQSRAMGEHLSMVRDAKAQLEDQLKIAKSKYKEVRAMGVIENMKPVGETVLQIKSKIQQLQKMERYASHSYMMHRTALDSRYPDAILERQATGKGTVRVRGNTLSQAAADDIASRYVPRPKPEPRIRDESPSEPVETYKPEHPSIPYDGPNLNEGAFGAEDIAELERQHAADLNEPRNADADRAWIDSIIKGEDDRTALQRYADTAGVSADEAAHHISDDSAKVLNLDETSGSPHNNPEYGKYKMPKATDTKTAVQNRNAITATYSHLKQLVSNAIDTLKPEDQELLHRLRSEDPQAVASDAKDPEQFMRVAAAVKHANDLAHALGEEVGQQTPYRQFYGARQFFDMKRAGAQDALDSIKAKIQDNPAYAKSRQFANYEVGEQHGLTRLNDSFKKDMLMDLSQRQRHQEELTLAKGLKEAHGGNVSLEQPGMNENGTHKQLQILGGRKIFADAKLADKINSRAEYNRPPGLAAVPGKVYDEINGFYKDMKLSGGFFHDLNTGAGYLASQIFSKHILEFKQLSPLLAKMSTKYVENLKEGWESNGTGAKMRMANLRGIYEDAASEATKVRLTSGKYNPLHALHESLFKREIPTMSGIIFEQETRHLDINSAEDVAKMRRIASTLNNGFFGADHSVEGLTPKQAKTAGRLFLAPGYEEGQIRNVMTAFSKGGPEGRIARQILFGRAALFALPGLVAAGQAGQLNDPKKAAETILKQLVDPSVPLSFKNSKGESMVGHLPTNPISKLVKVVTPLAGGKGVNPASGLEHEVTGNSSALISIANQLRNNKDYYGKEIIVHNADGTVNIKATSLQVAASQGPIPAGQFIKAANGKETLQEAFTNLAGVRSGVDPNDPKAQAAQAHFASIAAAQESLNGITNKRTKDEFAAYLDRNAQINKDGSTTNIKLSDSDKKAQAQQLFGDDKLRKVVNSYQQGQNTKDPLYHASDAQQKLYYQYESKAVGDPQRTVLLDRNPDLKKLIGDRDTYYKDANFSGGSSIDAPGTPKYPTFDDATNAKLQQLTEIYAKNDLTDADKQQLSSLYADPQVVAAQKSLHEYQSATRVQTGDLALKDKPTIDPAVEKAYNAYLSLPKGDGKHGGSPARAAFIKNNPDTWGSIQNYLAQQDLYKLDKNASLDTFEGQTPNQKELSAAEALGKYDIAMGKDANGKRVFTLDPGLARNGGVVNGVTYAPVTVTGGSGGYSPHYSSGGGYNSSANGTGTKVDTKHPTNGFYSKTGGMDAMGANFLATVGGATRHNKTVKIVSPGKVSRIKGLYSPGAKYAHITGRSLHISSPKVTIKSKG
jgi:hypothetical protein